MQLHRIRWAATAAVLPLAGALAVAQEGAFDAHVDQGALRDLVAAGMDEEAFIAAFDGGDEVFFNFFNVADGVGANVGNGQRFTRVPRADLDGPGQWKSHFPARPTGPNEQSCGACHTIPFGDGAGLIAHNAVRDPFQTGDISMFIERQTTHLFASGALQRVAEEMNEELEALRDQAAADACASGLEVEVELVSKGVSFGTLTAIPSLPGVGGGCTVAFDTSGLEGIDEDLVPKPFGWKGDTTTSRDFSRNASHRELGMQPIELVGYGVDGDGDSVVDELTVGDETAIVIYTTAQPRPTTELELSRLDLIDPLPIEDVRAINRGRATFIAVGCSTCHVPSMTLLDPIFSEPSQNPNYRDTVFPSGLDPVAEGLDPAFAVTYDLRSDQPDNQIFDDNGVLVRHLGALKTDAMGHGIVELFGDLKRHDMGPGLAESVDEIGTGASVWMTENLWGVGSTAPYLHDGRATTLSEAILLHAGDAQVERDAFAALPQTAQDDVVRFLQNLVLFVDEGDEDE